VVNEKRAHVAEISTAASDRRPVYDLASVAKKSRTPPPPRPVQSPKARSSERSAPGGRTVAIVVVVVLVIAAIAAGSYFAFGGKSSSKSSGGVAAAMAAAGCTLHTYPSAGRGHITTLNPTSPPKYNSFPPTSGRHYYIPAVWGSYDTPVNQYQAIHNLEHGGIVIQYGSGVSKATVAKIGSFYQSDPVALLVAPLPKLGNKVAMTAWTHLAVCTGFDEAAYKAFRDAYRYHAPEKFPPSALQPGT
jgi:hypothetical protein